MKPAVVVFTMALLVSVCGAQNTPPSAPQQSGSNAPQPPATGTSQDDNAVGTLKKRVDLVNLIFTVTDKHGRFMKDLQQDQFKVLDNHQPPEKIYRFEAQTNLPLRVGLLIDASDSIRDRFLFEQNAATEFLQQIIRPQTDKAFVMAFDEVPEIKQDFTNDKSKLTAGIKGIRPGGGTAMWDAIYSACRDKLLREKNTGPVRRAIILVSDGDDNESRVTPQEAIAMAQRAEVIIYAISTSLTNIHHAGDHNLKLLAEATGGRTFFPLKLDDLAGAFASVQGELRSQYAISYKPAAFEANGQYRTIQVVADKKFEIRARRGYFAPRE